MGQWRSCGKLTQLADWDAHALGPQVPQAQDPLPISHHHRPHIVLRPVAHHVVHVALVVDRDEQALNIKVVFGTRASSIPSTIPPLQFMKKQILPVHEGY